MGSRSLRVCLGCCQRQVALRPQSCKFKPFPVGTTLLTSSVRILEAGRRLRRSQRQNAEFESEMCYEYSYKKVRSACRWRSGRRAVFNHGRAPIGYKGRIHQMARKKNQAMFDLHKTGEATRNVSLLYRRSMSILARIPVYHISYGPGYHNVDRCCSSS